MSKSTRKRAVAKPAKPYPDFPLFPHATRRWAKKIKGKFVYFGPWDDPDGALQRYLDRKDDLYAGRTPRVSSDSLTVCELINRFLTEKQQAVDAGELHPRTWKGYHDTCGWVVECFGRSMAVKDLRPEDFSRLRFELAKTMGPETLRTNLTRVRVLFKWGYDSDLLEKPVKCGPGFKSPSKRVMLQNRNANGGRMFSADELRRMIDAADTQLRALILLGLNCGFGNNDCATLKLSTLDAEPGWIDHARPKTGVPRRCPLWPETVQALGQAIATRPKPETPEDAELVFLSSRGRRLMGTTAKRHWRNAIWPKFNALVTRLGLQKPRRGFYSLRHVFETVAGGSKDQIAVDAIMGHVTPGEGTTYRESIDDSRLQAVVDYVRRWLFGESVDQDKGNRSRRSNQGKPAMC